MIFHQTHGLSSTFRIKTICKTIHSFRFGVSINRAISGYDKIVYSKYSWNLYENQFFLSQIRYIPLAWVHFAIYKSILNFQSFFLLSRPIDIDDLNSFDCVHYIPIEKKILLNTSRFFEAIEKSEQKTIFLTSRQNSYYVLELFIKQNVNKIIIYLIRDFTKQLKQKHSITFNLDHTLGIRESPIYIWKKTKKKNVKMFENNKAPTPI